MSNLKRRHGGPVQASRPFFRITIVSFTFLQALSKTLTADELYYLREQFALLGPSKNGSITLDNIRTVGVVVTLSHQNVKPLCCGVK